RSAPQAPGLPVAMVDSQSSGLAAAAAGSVVTLTNGLSTVLPASMCCRARVATQLGSFRFSATWAWTSGLARDRFDSRVVGSLAVWNRWTVIVGSPGSAAGVSAPPSQLLWTRTAVF